MKKVLLSIIVFSLVLSGCTPASQPKTNTNQDEPHIKYAECLTLSDIKTALAREDLQLIENREESPAYYQADSVMPVIFNIKGSNQILLVYVFKTIAERKNITDVQVPLHQGNYLNTVYPVRNVLIIDILNYEGQKSISNDEQVLKTLEQITFSLNDIQKVIYKAKGIYWDAQYTADYYQHWYKDENGIKLDQYSQGKWEAKYIGPDPESVKVLSFKCETPSGGISGTDSGILDKIGDSYFLTIGGSTNNSSIPDTNSVLTMSIKWDGKEESLKLRASQKFLKYLQNKSWEEFAGE